MNPKTAKIVFYLFIFVVSIIEIKRIKKIKNISNYVWIALFFILIVASKPLIYWINPNLTYLSVTNEDIMSGSASDRLFFIVIGLLSLINICYRKVDIKQIVYKNKYLFIFFGYMLISILWSDYKMIAFKRWIKVLCGLLVAIALLSQDDKDLFFKTIIRRTMYILIPLSLLYVKYMKYLGVQYTLDGSQTMWVGVTTHKNSLGQLVAICCIFLLWDFLSTFKRENISFYLKKKDFWLDVLFLLMCFWLLKGSSTSRSSTSIFMFIIGSFILVLAYIIKLDLKKFGKYLIVFTILYGFLSIITLILIDKNFLTFIVESSGKDMTFTGRTFLWEAVLKIAKKHPILGVGYGSFWIGDNLNELSRMFIWGPKQSHNGYIDIYAELGIVGVCILITMIFATYKKIINNLYKDLNFNIYRLIMLIVIIIYNITEATYAKPTSFIWFIFILIAIDLPDNVLNKTKVFIEDNIETHDVDYNNSNDSYQ